MTLPQPEMFIQPAAPPSADWVAIGASVQGASHIKMALPCQDAHAYAAVGEEILVAAVADGLGSAALAQTGAALAARNAVSYAGQSLAIEVPASEAAWIELLGASFHFARVRLEEEAQQNQAPLREYGTTLILAILSPGWLAVGQIGDGATVAALEDGRLELMTAPQNDEYANVTYPLTMPDMESAAEFIAFPLEVKALALMSDGMQHVSIRTIDQEPHPPFFTPLFRQLANIKDPQKASQNLAEFMASEQICAKTDDDKTLVLIGRRQG